MSVARADDAGSTLVELLVVMLILGVIGSVAVAGSVSGMDSSRHAQDRVQALVETQTVVERVSRELRAADRLHEVAADYVDLEVVRADRRIRFGYEIDGAELIERRRDFEGEEALEHDFDTDAATPDTDSTRALLTGLVGAEMFTVYGGDGRSLDLDAGDHLRDVRRIELRVTRTVGSDHDDRAPIEVRTTVWPRNAQNLDGA